MNTLHSIAFLLMLIAAFLMWCGLKSRDNTIANKNILIDDMRASIAQLVFEREDAQRLIEMKNKQISGHIRDATLLNAEVQWLRNCKDASEDLDAGELIADVEIMLEAEYLP